ncbi:sulfatase-like hydrolase/transferase [Vibrio natriegens]|uniref:sulfatase-like hydrolase/transferase n=1 Tax=Vibrio natriegens TaxID=691 RepID=UPI001FBA2BA3|nr:sulfatase-like hydrolase/transferase [Vibrio natriegens]
MSQRSKAPACAYLQSLIIITLFSGYLYYLMEWLFFYFRPSMFSYLNITESIAVALIAPLPLVFVSVLVVFISSLLVLNSKSNLPIINLPIKYIALLIPGFILACTIFLMFDNFTYNLLHFATPSANNILSRGLYWLLFIGLLVYFIWRLKAALYKLVVSPELYRKLSYVSVGLIILSILSMGIDYMSPPNAIHDRYTESINSVATPNIIVFSADGVNSNHMSLYGYARKTTPFFEQISNESMVFHNHWTNSAKTTGSMGAMLSGKYPTRTKVIFRPDTFRGKDMYQHLPAILKQAGYFNIDITLRYYIDPIDLKLRNSFDYANRREFNHSGDLVSSFLVQHWPDSGMFLEETWQRLYQRIQHLSGHVPMVNPHQLVSGGIDIPKGFSDRDRLEQLKEQIASAPRPYFANVHLLGPHGNKFSYETPVFTDTKYQPEMWMLDHYDNAIYQWDAYSQELYELLEEKGELDNTVLIFTSDHGVGHTINNTLPLIIRFPNSKPNGIVSQSSERIDIAPTLLSLLGIQTPDWMDGQNLLTDKRPAKPIFIVSSPNEQVIGMGEWKAAKVRPPFYTLGSLSLMYCGELYTLDLNNPQDSKFTQKSVDESDEYCSNTSLTRGQAYRMLIQHLIDTNYDVSMLPVNLDQNTLVKQ